ncbi:MAG: histidine kinase [Muribaculaceae bacterium]|nr:histidine kinase [Muribaculaceae bacterium]MDE5903590.1 histidine kinase [Muribaculaceae bacterium]
MVALSPVERWYHNFSTYVIVAGTWLYLLYFINRAFTVPWLFGTKRKIAGGVTLIILSFAFTLHLSRVRLYHPKPSIFDQGIVIRLPQIQQYQEALWTLFMLVEAFSFAVGLLTQTNIQRNRRREAEALLDKAEIERDKAEIQMYKSRIKPHFMFNTLNSLYGLFIIQSPNALPSLEKFIEMMRYINTTAGQDLVPLADESRYIREYVEVQSLRLNHMTDVRLSIDIKSPDLGIPPMLLVTFVENCFKYGISPIEHSAIHISLSEDNGILRFATFNRICSHDKRDGEHMGISNCRRRLQLLYPDSHTLQIGPDGNDFRVSLTINLSACRLPDA